ncbi:G protein subunit beta, partial [Bonamia ostreae]
MADQSKLIKELNDKIEELRGDPNNSPLRDFSSRKARTKPKLTIKNRKVLKGHFAKIYAISWSSTKKLVSASQDGKMIIWDAMSTNKIMAVPLKSSWVMTCSFSP